MSDVKFNNSADYKKIKDIENEGPQQKSDYDILMVTLPMSAVASTDICNFSSVSNMVIIIVSLLIMLLVLYITDITYVPT